MSEKGKTKTVQQVKLRVVSRMQKGPVKTVNNYTSESRDEAV